MHAKMDEAKKKINDLLAKDQKAKQDFR